MSVSNLSSTEAVQKIRDLTEAASVCLFATALDRQPVAVRPMGIQQVDEEGNLWFFSNKFSDKNEHITANSKVQLFFSNKNDYEFLTIYGDAVIIVDREKAESLWTPIAKTWFHEGAGDPELTLICVRPLEAYYWDTKSNKIVSLLKIAAGAILGKTLDNGVEGKIKM